MANILVIATLILVLFFGAAAYIAASFTAIIYWLGANDKPIRKRRIFGILGLLAIWLFVVAVVYLVKNGWPL